MVIGPGAGTHVDADYIQGIDPLDADPVMPRLRSMNDAADVPGLVSTLRKLLPAAAEIGRFSLPECLAAMRDLGLVAGSVKRHGREPVEVVPNLTEILLGLAARSGMIPRDTVYHYIRWNPQGARERMYTGHPMERLLMSSVRMCLPNLLAAVELCRELSDLDPGEIDFTLRANDLVVLLRSTEDAIDTTLANVSPEFFAVTLRPYFEKIRVGDEAYLGPAAAHLPLSLIDLKLWASDNGGLEYDRFWVESARYGLPGWRRLYRSWSGEESLVTRLVAALRTRPESTGLLASAEALSRALRSLVVFRGKHLSIARKAYADEIRHSPLGSGGGSLDLLAEILALTKRNAQALRASFARAHLPSVKPCGW